MRAVETTKPPSEHEEEHELDELPPIDGDDVDGDEADEASSEDLDDEPDDGGDPMDDSTGEGDALEEIEASGDESGWLEDAGDSEALDVGTPDTFGAEEESPTLLEGAEEPDVGEDELPLAAEDGPLVAGDTGEEGFDEEEEALREEDLPRLDSGSDDAEGDDPDLLTDLPEEDAAEELRPPWDDRAWERVEAVASPVADEGTVVSTPRAGVKVSDDGGKSFREANGWRALLGLGAAEGALEVVTTGGEIWGKTAKGEIAWSGDRGMTWSRVLPETRFEAIAADPATGQLVALARDEDAATTVARGGGGRLVLSSAGPLPGGEIRSLAAYDGRLAVALGRGAFQLEDGVWTRLDGTAGLTAMTFTGSGSLVIALHSEGEGRAWILEARPGAPALTVAEIGDAAGSSAHDDGDGARVRTLRWDGAAGVAWATGGFGLIALRPARR